MRVDKEILKTTMLGLEAHQLQASRDTYAEYLKNAHVERSDVSDAQDAAQAFENAHYAESFDAPVHEHQQAIELISGLDFSATDVVRPGAVVEWNGQSFVISALTQEFECQGHQFMGVSCDAPITQQILGKSAGDTFELNGSSQTIQDVY